MEDKKKAVQADPDYIDLADHDEVGRWADLFGVTNAKIKSTVNIVGASAKKVQAYLSKTSG